MTLLQDATFNKATLKWDSPEFTPKALDYTLSGDTTNVHSTLLQKSNGKFYLCLWQEINFYNIDNKVEADIENSNVNVTLNLKTPIASAVSYLPTSGTDVTALKLADDSIDLSVPDQVLIVELTPAANTKL